MKIEEESSRKISVQSNQDEIDHHGLNMNFDQENGNTNCL